MLRDCPFDIYVYIVVLQLVQLANDVGKELRANVIQAVQVAPDRYRKSITTIQRVK